MTTLGNERGGNATTQHVQYDRQFWRIVDEVKRLGRADDPLVRQRLAWAYSHVEIMRYAANPQYLPDMAMSGATYLADEAKVRGLVDEVVEPAALMERAIAAAKALGALSPAAFVATKEQLRQQVADNMARHAARVDARVDEIWSSDETLKNIRDFVAKTIKKG